MGGGTGEAGGVAGTGGRWTAGRGRGMARADAAWSTPGASGGEEQRHGKFNKKARSRNVHTAMCNCCHTVAAQARKTTKLG